MSHCRLTIMALLLVLSQCARAVAVFPYSVDNINLDTQALENYDQLYQDAATQQFKIMVEVAYDGNSENNVTLADAVDALYAVAGASSTSDPYDFWQVPDLPFVYLVATQKRLQKILQLEYVSGFRKSLTYEPLTRDSLIQIDQSGALANGFSGSGKSIVIIDSGVDKNNPLLSGRVVREGCFARSEDHNCFAHSTGRMESLCGGLVPYNGPAAYNTFAFQPTNVGQPCSIFVPNAQYASVDDMAGCGHGTHVAGIAARVAPSASIISLQTSSLHFLGCTAGKIRAQRVIQEDDVIGALNWVVQNPDGIAAVNMSLGGACFGTSTGPMEPLVSSLKAMGIATIMATGNTKNRNSFSAPACNTPSAIKVGAVEKSGIFATYTDTADLPKYILAPGGNYDAPGGPGGVGSLLCDINGTCGLTGVGTGAQCSICSANPASFMNCTAQDVALYPCACGNPIPQYCARTGTSMAAPHVAAAFAAMSARFPQAQQNILVDTVFSLFETTGTTVNIPATIDPNGPTYQKKRINLGAASLAAGNPSSGTLSMPVCGTAHVEWIAGALGNPDTFEVQFSTNSFSTFASQSVSGTVRSFDFNHTLGGTVYARVRGCFNGHCPAWGSVGIPTIASFVTQVCSTVGTVRNLTHRTPTLAPGGCTKLTWDPPITGTVTAYQITKNNYAVPAVIQTTEWITHDTPVNPIQPLMFNGTYSVRACNNSDCGAAVLLQVNGTSCSYISLFTPPALPISPNEDSVTQYVIPVASANVQLTVGDIDPPSFPASSLVIGGVGLTRTLTVTPPANYYGESLFELRAIDGAGGHDEQSVSMYVKYVNDAPTFTFRTACSVPGGSWNSNSTPTEFVYAAGSAATLSCSDFTVPVFGPANEAAWQSFATPNSVGVEVVSNSNPGLFSAPPNFNSVTNRLNFTTTGMSGIADIVVRIRDDGGMDEGGVDVSLPQTFRVRVVGATPSIGFIAAQNIHEDASTGGINFTVSDADSAASGLTVTAASGNTALVPVGGIVLGGAGSNRIVTVTPLTDGYGSATLTLTVSDGSQTSDRSFDVNVAPINDAPTFSNLGDRLLPSGTVAGLKSYSGWANAISMGPSNESNQSIAGFYIEVLAESDAGFINGDPQITNLGTLRFVLGSSSDGFACLRVTLFDDGPDNSPNVNASVPVDLRIQVGAGSGKCEKL